MSLPNTKQSMALWAYGSVSWPTLCEPEQNTWKPSVEPRGGRHCRAAPSMGRDSVPQWLWEWPTQGAVQAQLSPKGTGQQAISQIPASGAWSGSKTHQLVLFKNPQTGTLCNPDPLQDALFRENTAFLSQNHINPRNQGCWQLLG